MLSRRWVTIIHLITSAQPSTGVTKVMAAHTRSGKRSAPTLLQLKAITPTSSSTGPFALACTSAALSTQATISVLGLLQASSSEPSFTWTSALRVSAVQATQPLPLERLRRQVCPTRLLQQDVQSALQELARGAVLQPRADLPLPRFSPAVRCLRLLHLPQLQYPQQRLPPPHQCRLQ